MQKIIITILILGLTTPAFAKAYFAGKEEMILKSDVIAIVDITNVIYLEPEKQYGNQEAKASVIKILKGNIENNFTFFIPNFFPCAIVSVEKGYNIVFLKREENKLRGVNWHFSYRPIKDNKVEWYSNGETLKLEEKSLEKIIEEVTELIKKQKFEKIQKDVEVIFNKYQIEYEISRNNNKLTIKYNTNKFVVHPIDKTGYISPNPHEELGPNHDGLLLELSIQEGEYLGQSVIPQEIQRPYWKTYISAYSINNKKEYIWYANKKYHNKKIA